MTDRLLFLGTGDSMGVPRVYCTCGICEEARNAGTNRRYRSSVLLETAEGKLAVDCGPDWRQQMERLGQREMERLLITHAHFDHIGGLPEWADACRWLSKKGHVYAPHEVVETIRSQFPWLHRQLIFHALDPEGFEFAGWTIHPWKVCHGKNGFSYAYRFDKTGYSWVYCPDSIRLSEEEKKPLHGLNLLVLGTNFYLEEAEPLSRSVYDMTEALGLIGEVRPEHVIFTHMSHGVDINKSYPLPRHVQLARTGLSYPLNLADKDRIVK
ncbi:MBL fold metallo-hydrolase [Paenibacillus thalictri]|uniref:MBL fold metallo-hydrolase n=1 Tax=Paenibacillus thalictri TaxID=2527873 RepID=A0A4Q9DKR9_9BACL|nr:MBL fold metallo-hydrolase [Paenibacillus thalictri]TBL75348.1 MBL fold metallo-hydrolase [Paenibacillus thalictri]